MDRNNSCCFIGHRSVKEKEKVEKILLASIEELIENEGVTTFFFGSRGDFNALCKKVLKTAKEKYPHIKRIYVRAEYQFISDTYKAYLLKSCDDTYYPEKIERAGKAVYVERNYEMINNSRYCIAYFDENYASSPRKRGKKDIIAYQPQSGTRLAYQYAMKKGCITKNLYTGNESQ